MVAAAPSILLHVSRVSLLYESPTPSIKVERGLPQLLTLGWSCNWLVTRDAVGRTRKAPKACQPHPCLSEP